MVCHRNEFLPLTPDKHNYVPRAKFCYISNTTTKPHQTATKIKQQPNNLYLESKQMLLRNGNSLKSNNSRLNQQKTTAKATILSWLTKIIRIFIWMAAANSNGIRILISNKKKIGFKIDLNWTVLHRARVKENWWYFTVPLDAVFLLDESK